MKTKHSNIIANSLQNYFSNYLPNLRGMSSNTILSYRDSFKLLLQFIAQEKKKQVVNLEIEDIGVDEIIIFLDHLEKNFHNKVSTRNIRLSAIHSFFRYFSGMYPEHLGRSQRILNIPFKRTNTKIVEYLEFDEIQALLQAIDRSNTFGRRDYVLLSIMFNTGARVQETVDLKATDLQLTRPFSVKFFGKGRKERVCPLWPQTIDILRKYLEEKGIDSRKPTLIFTNHLNKPLTRFGVRYILAKYVRLAGKHKPSLKKKRLHPHCLRHSTAIHLLKSGVDLASISLWLGHNSVNTANKYAKMDLEMKRKALEKARPLDKIKDNLSWCRE